MPKASASALCSAGSLEAQRQRSRSILDQLSVGERFMLMFGRGVLKRDPLRIELKEDSHK
jgi:hypothetical protein